MRHTRLSRDKLKKHDESSEVDKNKKSQPDEMMNSGRSSKPKERDFLEKELYDHMKADKASREKKAQVTFKISISYLIKKVLMKNLLQLQ